MPVVNTPSLKAVSVGNNVIYHREFYQLHLYVTGKMPVKPAQNLVQSGLRMAFDFPMERVQTALWHLDGQVPLHLHNGGLPYDFVTATAGELLLLKQTLSSVKEDDYSLDIGDSLGYGLRLFTRGGLQTGIKLHASGIRYSGMPCRVEKERLQRLVRLFEDAKAEGRFKAMRP